MTTPPATSLPERYEVGKLYSVPCVKSVKNHRWDRLFYGQWVPVIGPRHSDAEFIAFPHDHWHIDWRFASESLWKRVTSHYRYGMDAPYHNILTCYPVRQMGEKTAQEDRDDPFYEGGVVHRRMKCKREFRPYPRHLSIRWMAKLEAAYCDTKLKGMVCPHKGLPLEGCQRDADVVTCPGHGLRWNVKTGELVRSA